jgi:hypothetical protein
MSPGADLRSRRSPNLSRPLQPFIREIFYFPAP